MKKAYLRRAPGNSGEGTLGMVEGVIVPFGSPALRDSYGNWWDQKSDFVLSAYSNRPLFNYHTGDGHYNRAGYILDDSLELRDEGLFAKGVILDNDEGRTFLRDLERGKSYYSTGVMPNQMAIRDDGYVERWPIVEVSQVPNPAAFRGETRVSQTWPRASTTESRTARATACRSRSRKSRYPS